MRFKFLSILLFILGFSSNLNCLYSPKHEPYKAPEINLVEENEESVEKPEKPISRLTQVVDKLVEWNQNYIIPLSYAYIFYDYSRLLYGHVKNIWYIDVTSERIYPNYSGNNPTYQKLVSKITEVAQKIGTMPRSIIITKDSSDLTAAYLRDIIISESFFENKSENEVDYIIAHELSHIKKYHKIIGGVTAVALGQGYSLQFNNVFDTSYEYNNAKKIFRMIYTSPLLYHFCAKLIWYAISRYCEKDADLTAAAAVGVEGGIEWCKVLGVKTGFFDTHPRAQERFEYFQAFKKTL
jgi:Zn-dependent protease with chaperone function